MRYPILVILIFMILPLQVVAEEFTPPHAAIVSAHPLATEAGQHILEQGGNGFDAAVAVSAALAVVEPFGSGIGGGGFWMIYNAASEDYLVIDSRETAPIEATANMYLDEHGNVIENASKEGPLAAGIPGLPAAYAEINKRFGKLSLQDVLAPAIKLAQEGFPVDERYVNGAKVKQDLLLENKDAASIFLDDGDVPKVGWVLKQTDLATTLSKLAKEGYNGFYSGDVAKKLVTDVRKNGGIWTMQDLAEYRTIDRKPVIIEYKKARIIAPPLPSSGGLVLSNIFNILSHYELDNYGKSDQIHLVAEAMRHGYHNRALYMGDSDFVDVPIETITDKRAAAKQQSMINIQTALPSKLLPSVTEQRPKGTDTTHFNVLDTNGNRIAVTQSINFWFGSGFVPKGTGVLLNNEMDDFTVKVGSQNGYGLTGTQANAIAPRKRMLSSMTPTFVETHDGIALLGTPGGSRIISMNLLAILDFIEGGNAQSMVSLPRFHHQYIPDKIFYESDALNKAMAKSLSEKGHKIEMTERDYGNMQSIVWSYKDNTVETASDPRGHGAGRVY